MASEVTIPKIIHYCWFGGNPLPELALKCIVSWRKFLPDYEIREWNESNFDVDMIPYTREAYAVGKYAFVSDYARFWILYRHGGLYFDTDVEVIRPLDDIVAEGPFMGCENDAESGSKPDELGVNPGLGLGATPGLGLYKDLLDMYARLHFVNDDKSLRLKTVVEYTTELLVERGLDNTSEIQFVDGIYIYPREYFSPKSIRTGILTLTRNTRSIHHYAASWCGPVYKIKRFFYERIAANGILFKIYKYLKR